MVCDSIPIFKTMNVLSENMEEDDGRGIQMQRCYAKWGLKVDSLNGQQYGQLLTKR